MIQNINFQNILVAVDGSDYSIKAYKQCQETFGLIKEKINQTIILHITNSKKDYLPLNYQGQQIYDYYIENCLQYQNQRLIIEEQNSELPSCREQILNIANNMQISFIFVGYYGRKQEKKDKNGMSQTVKHLCFHSQIPVFIIKELVCRSTDSSPITYLACLDGSNKAYKALNVCLSLRNQGDKFIFCYAPTPDKQKFSKIIKAKLEQELENFKDIAWQFLELETSFQVVQSICQYINKNKISYVVIGNNGYRAQLENKNFFGNTGEQIVLNSNSNIIIIP
ncbi:hypothetical protein IMG5_080800 [Ichthyophthirius multifiliis]|uniref:UspA domain-containing protein n=1 Tax=Ichthyophthirius multifiliis TaxID=5932 RepID=G0QQK6_ICHMU|nr:hypothetical protein IMG5_080800 [Ichthyophthirius multifiliis]EGR32500.1 hypothetical protein IMG5_080800 [Ichthyophthirius multifiliis]|eukprot:XP_004036486.1 hypothetical protein IMG5_080800 [Ichthyophthirius multifiliis]